MKSILKCIGLSVVIIKFTKNSLSNKKKHENRIDKIYKENINCVRYQQSVICMIDLCNYSQWCENKYAMIVYYSMKKYNLFLTDILCKYKLLEKIEIVGDCVMVVGWVPNIKTCERITEQIIRFAMEVLQNINRIQAIFQDENISVRIGIHKGNTCCGFMSNPRKFQVFGNSVNMASRIESVADNGTCMISDVTLESLKYKRNSIDFIHKGDFELKGLQGRLSCSEVKQKI
jgi:class 3 adenylate cyclase